MIAGYKTVPEIRRGDFMLPPELEAGEPPEVRGLARDEVRLMVSYHGDNRVVHTRFRAFGDFLDAGDVLVINTSGTMNAALEVTRADGTPLGLHLSTPLPADLWIVEVRVPHDTVTKPYFDAVSGETLRLPGAATAKLLAPYVHNDGAGAGESTSLWIALLRLPQPLHAYLTRYGSPIRYGYVKRAWPAHYYQTVYATEPGSAEMPSAGRAFTPELITTMIARGVQIAPTILHTGISGLGKDVIPYQEFYRVPPHTARLVNATRAAHRRVVAVGTTVVRALETVTDEEGITHPGEGWTGLVITSQYDLRAIDGMLTGLHEPGASHRAVVEALAGREHLELAYAEALRERYFWHEFGDLHLILP